VEELYALTSSRMTDQPEADIGASNEQLLKQLALSNPSAEGDLNQRRV
jgi:hypothetical protein